MKQRILAMMLLVALLLSVLPSVSAVEGKEMEVMSVPKKEDYALFSNFDPAALEQRTEKGYTFVIHQGEAVILSVGEEATERITTEDYSYKNLVKVPAELGGATVTALWDKCFYSQGYRTVVLPDSIRWIGDRAFEKAYSTTFETLPASLEYVGDYAFEQASINGETFPEGLRFIGDFAFQDCRIPKISFGNQLEYMGRYAFYGVVVQDSNVTLPESLRYAGEYMFRVSYGKTSMKVRVLSRELVCDHAFEYVESVTGYSGSTVEEICGNEGIPFYNIETGELYDPTYEVTVDNVVYRVTRDHAEVIDTENASKVKQLVIADQIDGKPVTVINTDSIGSNDVAWLEILILPDTIREIEQSAIYHCEKLYYIRMSDNLVRGEEGMITGCHNLVFLYMPPSFTEYIIHNDIYDDGLFTSSTSPYVAARPGSFAYTFCKDHGCAMLTAREGYTYLGDRNGIYETDGLTARYLAMINSSWTSPYDPFVFPDSAYGIPVTTIAGDLRYDYSNTTEFGYMSAILGANVTVVEPGAFSRSRLRELCCGPNVKELPYPLFFKGAEQFEHAVIGYTGSYVEQYCKEYGYNFLPIDSAPFEDVNLTDWFNEAVSYCYWGGLMNGVSEDRFAPNATTTRAMVAKVLYNLSGQPYLYGWKYGFKDVGDSDWFEKAVNWCSYYGITQGTSSTHFSPNQPVTREQLVTFFYRYGTACKLTMTERKDLGQYADAGKVSSFAKEPMQWAVAAGIVQGKSANRLNPEGQATRAEIAAILMRFTEYAAAQKDAKILKP